MSTLQEKLQAILEKAENDLAQFYSEDNFQSEDNLESDLLIDEIQEVQDDMKCIRELYQWAAEKGDANAQFHLGYCYFNGYGSEKDLKRAIELYKQAAEQRNVAAESHLGRCYYYGLGLVKDMKCAFAFYQRAAMQGDVYSQFKLAKCYQNGYGVEKDMKHAVELYKQAAAHGYSNAQSDLGNCFYNGTGVAKDHKRAFELFQEAARKGYTDAIYNLAICYEYGSGIAKDMCIAIELYQQAAIQGIDISKYYLGVCYVKGLGLPININRAVLLYQNIPQNMDAQNNLAKLLQDTQLNFPELDKAVSYYVKMKDSSTLGFCYQFGLGTAQNLKQAVFYFKQAIQQFKPCYSDLFFCYRNMRFDNLVKIEIQEFINELEKNLPDISNHHNLNYALSCDKLLCLANLYEKGELYCDQNLYKAFKYYKMITNVKNTNNDDLKCKIEKFSSLTAYESLIKKVCAKKNLYSAPIASILAEYAFEPEGEILSFWKRSLASIKI